MSNSNYQHITYGVEDKIGRLNLVSGGDAFLNELRSAVHDAQSDRDMRVLVVSGGDKMFLSDEEPNAASGDRVDEVFSRLEGTVADVLVGIDKPTIASVAGLAVGAGCDIAIGCDIRIGGSSARIGVTGITTGDVSGPAVYLLPRIVGLGKANELIFTGDVIGAAEAGRIGLFDQVVQAGDLGEATVDMARRIANGPPVAMRFTKRAIYRGLSSTAESAKEYTTLSRSLAMRLTEETREGFDSFNEKRPPRF